MTSRIRHDWRYLKETFASIESTMDDWSILNDSDLYDFQKRIGTLAMAVCLLQASVSEEVGRGKGFKR